MKNTILINLLAFLVMALTACTTSQKVASYNGARDIAQVVNQQPAEKNESKAEDWEKIPPLNLAQDDWALPTPSGPKSKLFRSNEILNLVIRGNFPIDKYGGLKKGYEIRYKTKTGEKVIPISVEPRGKSRAGYCSFAPIRIVWGDDLEREGTTFDKIRGTNMKLVVHCEYTSGTIAEHEQANNNVLKEYAMYKLLKAWGLPAFEVRLAKIQYQNLKGENVVEGFGFFIEPNPSLASRYGLKHQAADGYPAVRDTRVYLPYYLSRLIVSATDFYVEYHNTEHFLGAENKSELAVPYDFNDSSLVNGRGFNYGEFPAGSLTTVLNGNNPRGWGRGAAVKDVWQKSFYNYANALLEQEDFVFEYLDKMPLPQADKFIIKAHFTKFSDELKALVDAHKVEELAKQNQQ